MSQLSPPAICVRCLQPLSPGVSFCAGCGFDNGAMLRQSKQVALDEEIKHHMAWLWFKQRFLWWLPR